jgi:hypothetical protein
LARFIDSWLEMLKGRTMGLPRSHRIKAGQEGVDHA